MTYFRTSRPDTISMAAASLTAILLAILLTVSAMIVPLSAAETPTYADVKKNDWFYDSVKTVCLAGLMEGMPIPEILKMSSKASSIAVTREGAVPSIPYRSEVMESLAQN